MELSPLIGRKKEASQLTKDFKEAAAGKGKIILLGGEAGMGKTRLAKHAADKSNLAIYSAIANETANPPYSLFIDIFRSYLRGHPKGFSNIGPIKPFLAQLLPEISNSPIKSDPNSLVEAILSAVETIAKKSPTLFLLDDLHWADNATLELIPKLAPLIHDSSIVVLGVYRNDEIPRGHPLRGIRNDLRRANYLNEITIEAFSKAETQRLSEQLLQSSISPSLSQLLHYKTQGTPFFVEELIKTMQENNLLHTNGEMVDLSSNDNIPVPETVRDAILIRFDKLSQKSRDYLENASVVGQQFSFEDLALLGENEGLEEAIQNGFLVKLSAETGKFRHALTREAIYNEIHWSKARHLHKKIARNFELSKAAPEIIAEHWKAGKESEKARLAYIKVVNISLAIHAYTDSASAAKKAINLWPEGKHEKERLTMLDQLGHSAQLSGSLNDAGRAWREAAESYKNINAIGDFAEVQKKIATLYGLQGSWDQSMSAHETAAKAFIEAGNLVEATNELIAIVGHLHASGKYNKAIPSAEQALNLAEEINDFSLIAKARGYLGSLKTRVGFPEEGTNLAQSGLSLALEKNLYSVASELYLRLAAIMEHIGNYDEAKNIYDTSIKFCEMRGLSPYIDFCLACASVVSFQAGDFQEVKSINEGIILSKDASPNVIAIAKAMLGISQSIVGELILARENLNFSLSEARNADYLNIGLLSNWGLALADCQENNVEAAKNHLLDILKALSFSDESHYSINMLRFAASFFCSVGDGEHTRASADAVAKIATTLSNYESLGGLAHALGEVAMVNDDYSQAIEHFEKAIDLISDKNLPIEEAETKYRAGLAYFALDKNEKGIELLSNAYQLLYPTGEKYYSQKIITTLEEEGISAEKFIGKRKVAKAKHSGLTRRQVEVMKLIASGMSNQEIADKLVLSVRTVEMHVSNILAELGCRSRTEAVTKANKIGLLKISL